MQQAGISPNDVPQNEEELWKMIDKIKDIALKNKKVNFYKTN